MIKICVDVMGSDKDPRELMSGLAEALAADSDLELLVVGDEGIVVPFADPLDRVEALISKSVITMDEHPADAVRKKKDSSIVMAAKAVSDGSAQGLFSAGSTGAVLTAATFGIGRIKGIKRPALSSPLPGLHGHKTILLDLGANADVKPESLVQFAHMGSAYARVALGAHDPTVALLCNGSEDTKGSELALAYHAALAADDTINFAGNAEGTDILTGPYDVIVSDGFTANVALKTLEGTAKFISARIKGGVAASKRVALGALLLKPTLKEIASDLSGDEQGGAILLGLKAPVVKGHGATSAEAFKNGVLACAEAVRGGLCEKIADACMGTL
ncbi:phosphate acyltransferase PlsX [Coriobacteriales bacterium OH1046]|nr:phosphate acyltransferase PlsX [Coriobacteriales bacterium OH1046]